MVYLNGQLVSASGASISVSDVGFLHGASTFTTMRAHNAAVFRIDKHITRLLDTAQAFGLRTESDADVLKKGVSDLIRANSLSEARVRITLSPGSLESDEPTTLITATQLDEYPRRWYEKGIMVVVSSFRQPQDEPTVGMKTGCYFTRVLGQKEAAAKGAQEALWYTRDGRLAEGCFSNVFLVMEGKVFTPPLDTPVLPGILRETLCGICASMGIEFREEIVLTVDEMLGADEMFLTGSCSGIRPVVKVERHTVGDGTPGEITRRLMDAYATLLDIECPPSSK